MEEIHNSRLRFNKWWKTNIIINRVINILFHNFLYLLAVKVFFFKTASFNH